MRVQCGALGTQHPWAIPGLSLRIDTDLFLFYMFQVHFILASPDPGACHQESNFLLKDSGVKFLLVMKFYFFHLLPLVLSLETHPPTPLSPWCFFGTQGARNWEPGSSGGTLSGG